MYNDDYYDNNDKTLSSTQNNHQHNHHNKHSPSNYVDNFPKQTFAPDFPVAPLGPLCPLGPWWTQTVSRISEKLCKSDAICDYVDVTRDLN